MKTFILAVVTMAVMSFTAYAQEQITFPMSAPCAPKEQLLSGLSKYEERGLASGSVEVISARNGSAYEGDMHLFVNPKTFSYTMWVEFNDGSGIACIIAVGKGFGPYTGNDTEL